MSMLDDINNFDENYSRVESEIAVETAKIVAYLDKQLREITPIVLNLKEKHFYFFHPDLDQSIRTTVGAIIAKNSRNPREVYVFDGHSHLIKKIDTFSSEHKFEGSPIDSSIFLRECDPDFVLKGINHVRGMFDSIIEDRENTLRNRRRFVDQITEA